jgi:pimeloyl-ACP methyl ester carboxylesterase
MRRRLVKKAAFAVIIVISIILVALVGLRIAADRREGSGTAAPPASGAMVTTTKGRIFVSTIGPRDGQAVLFVHGSGAWSGLWQATSVSLAARGYRVIALDLPPFGFSDRPAAGDYGRTAQARRIMALVDAMQLSHPIIVGHSFGAGPAVEAVMRNPWRFRQLVLVDAALGIDAPSEPLPWLLRSQVAREHLVAATVTNPALTRTLLRQLIHRKERASPAIVAILQKPMGRPGSTAAVAHWLPSLLQADPTSLSGRASNYALLRGPVAIIWGADDTVTPVDQAARLRQLVPHAQMTILRDAGHIPQIERPAQFQAALAQVLTRPEQHPGQPAEPAR